MAEKGTFVPVVTPSSISSLEIRMGEDEDNDDEQEDESSSDEDSIGIPSDNDDDYEVPRQKGTIKKTFECNISRDYRFTE